jgi:hypothetical protein
MSVCIFFGGLEDRMENCAPKNCVVVTFKEYEELQRDRRLLSALKAMGVDNWEGYDAAVDIFNSGE